MKTFNRSTGSLSMDISHCYRVYLSNLMQKSEKRENTTDWPHDKPQTMFGDAWPGRTGIGWSVHHHHSLVVVGQPIY